ncbi:MAG: RNA-guided endonuclease InsQ/TnpB family protein [Anaerolineae bacterium]
MANRRKDFLNKLAHDLVSRYDHIALEDLRITNMVHNRHLAKCILDSGWGYFAQRLTSKAAEAGRVVCLADPAYTSKSCSNCGMVFESLTLADPWARCECGLSVDRDHNAALNILKRAGHVRWALSSPLGELAQEAALLWRQRSVTAHWGCDHSRTDRDGTLAVHLLGRLFACQSQRFEVQFVVNPETLQPH